MRYFVEISYLGKNYHGWQIQPNAMTVQEKIQQSLSTILRESIEIVGAGRTDAGVHASQIYAHFDYDKQIVKNDSNFIHKINAILPDDIVIHQIIPVDDDAHARFDAVSRSYEYKIILGRNPFFLDTSLQIKYDLDIDLMNQACQILFEYEDFESFSKVKTDVFTFNCTITEAQWKLNGDELTFYISANRFLRNMVRAIVGTLMDIGRKRITLDEFRQIIESKNRSKAGASVPAKALFLTKVEYNYL